MRFPRLLSTIAALAVTAVAVQAADANQSASPMFALGPQAESANVIASVAGTNYGLFTCQIPGLTAYTCYDPYQMRHAYGTDQLIANGLDGRGKTIVIIDAFVDPNITTDLSNFIALYGLTNMNGLGKPTDTSLPTFKTIAPQGGTAQSNNWSLEMSLDVEWAHAIAPGANITLVNAASNSNTDILAATKYAVDNNLGDVISQSFGQNESCVDPTAMAQQHQIFVEATQKHMTIFASAGDYGTTQLACGSNSQLVKAVSSPAVDPLVTAVGGTELNAAGYCLTVLGCDPTQNPTPGTRLGEIVWNESTEFPGGEATGGGFSQVFSEPPAQESVLHGGKQRGVPDVAYNAAVNHGVLVAFGPYLYLVGGTSAGSPQWAALAAIADQVAGYDLGYINAGVYHLAQTSATYQASFFDITSGNNSWAGITGYSASAGWDPTTGWGSPSTPGLITNLLANVSAGDGTAAIAASKPHSNAKPNPNGHVDTH